MAEKVVFMGVTEVRARVTGPTQKSAEVKFLVDSGANYTVLPNDIWRLLELKPTRTQDFGLADGTHITRRMSECRIELPDQGAMWTPVVLGQSEDVALLGVVTLEEFGLVLNPLDRTVRKARMPMMRVG